MTEAEIYEFAYPLPKNPLFDFKVGCLGCNSAKQVIFEDPSLFEEVNDLAAESGAPSSYNVSGEDDSWGGASPRLCRVRDNQLFSLASRAHQICPNESSLVTLAAKLVKIDGVIAG